jgi:glyoxylase-like metal-dependent hydrolase (beta-lactamase superfamily II)
MERRKFIQTLGIVTGGVFLQSNTAFNFIREKEYKFIELREGIGTYYNQGGTIGWMANKDSLIVVDSQFPEPTKLLWSELKKLTTRKIDVLFNTHHHRDHTSGNAFFDSFANNIVAHENCVKLQLQRNKPKDVNDKIVTARTTFKKEWKLDAGKEKLNAYNYGAAHTGGDAILHFENNNIAHVGDLVFNGIYPFINKDDEASISGWIYFLQDAVRRFDNDTLFIFGHAYAPEKVVGSKRDLNNMKNYLEALLDFVKKEIAAGKSDDQIM